MSNFTVTPDPIATEWVHINNETTLGEDFGILSGGLSFSCQKVGDGEFVIHEGHGYPEAELVVSGGSVRVSA